MADFIDGLSKKLIITESKPGEWEAIKAAAGGQVFDLDLRTRRHLRDLGYREFDPETGEQMPDPRVRDARTVIKGK